MVKIDDIIDEEELLDEDLDFAYGSKKKLAKAVDDDEMEAEDALFMEGYLDDE